jgi:sulfide:quinone oxidoreductase
MLRNWQGGRLVVNVVENPIKCPVAPLEFLMLADAFFRERHLRHRVELIYATPLPGAFTKPKAAAKLGRLLEERRIRVEPEFVIERVDPDKRTIVSYDERELTFDLLVSVPLNTGAAYVGACGIGDELNFARVDPRTLCSVAYPNIFALGDAANVPASKAGSVAHFEVDGFVDNFLRYTVGGALEPLFDGHANCFVETGEGKGLLIDFNYDTEPLPGRYPLPAVGPFTLLEESRINHWGKLAFRWIYWNVLLKGLPMPLPAQMSMAGKEQST